MIVDHNLLLKFIHDHVMLGDCIVQFDDTCQVPCLLFKIKNFKIYLDLFIQSRIWTQVTRIWSKDINIQQLAWHISFSTWKY